VPLEVVVDLGPQGGPLAVYCVLAAHANRAGECWPAQSVIAELTGLSDRSVRRAVRTLERVGLVVVLEVGVGRDPSRYRLTSPDVGVRAEESQVSAQNGQVTGHTVSPSPDAGVRQTQQEHNEHLAAAGRAFLARRR
jgi:hypothetical protein